MHINLGKKSCITSHLTGHMVKGHYWLWSMWVHTPFFVFLFLDYIYVIYIYIYIYVIYIYIHT